jgi:cobalt/nickel transport system permease protein
MKNKFIEHSLIKTMDFLRDEVFTQEYSQSKGFMQALDPRTKLISLVITLLLVLSVKNISTLLILYCASILFAYFSKINLAHFLKRVWIFIPLFSLLIAIPALFSVFSPGEKIFFSITRQGLFGAILFILRVLTSVSFSVLLVLTTSHASLLKALRSLGVPQIFVTVFMMCYRYVYIFIEIIEDTYLGIKSRIITNLKNRKTHKLIAWRIGTLWEKSSLMSEEVYLAMLSRGYSGEPKTVFAFKLKALDYLWLLSLIIVSIAIFCLDARKYI